VNASSHEPETPGQVEVWEQIKRQYVRLGLCHRCAAQAAYGHQLGFRALTTPPHEGGEPCPECAPVVATFEFDAPGPWRKASRDRLRGAVTRSSGQGGQCREHPRGADYL